MKTAAVFMLLALTAGCVGTQRATVSEDAVVGMFAATADSHAESRVRLKRDPTYERYTLLWHQLRSTPAGEVPESIGYESGRWILKERTVLLTSSEGKSLSLPFEHDAGASFLLQRRFRFRMLYPEEPNQSSEPTRGLGP